MCARATPLPRAPGPVTIGITRSIPITDVSISELQPLSATTPKTRERRDRNGWLTRLERLIRYRLQVPMQRSRKSPEHVARGVMIGTVWACSPVFGLHMLGVFLTWLATSKLFGWRFSLINGLAWTWTTNVFTVIPCYYVFFLTGQFMLGRFAHGAQGGEGFDALTAQIRTEHTDLWDAIVLWFESLVSNVGLPLAVGWIPWSIGLGWLAYRISYGFVVRHREHRDRRRRKRRAQRAQQASGEPQAQ